MNTPSCPYTLILTCTKAQGVAHQGTGGPAVVHNMNTTVRTTADLPEGRLLCSPTPIAQECPQEPRLG